MRRLLPLLLLLACDGATSDTDPVSACPRLQTDADALRFDDVLFESPVTRTLRVTQPCDGAADVVIDGLEVDGDDVFIAQTQAAVIQAGQTVLVDVRFEPGGSYASHAAALRIRTSAGEATVSLVGSASSDQDGDGVDAIEAGGQDCDDRNARVGVPTDESPNGVDDDCDGWVDEDFIDVGDVLISELMLRPSSVRSTVGQWVEVRNVSERAIDLRGWVLDGTEGRLQVQDSVVVEPGEHAVLAVETDPTDNGGIQVDGALVGTGTPLAIRDWRLALSIDERVIVALDEHPDWPDELGASIALDPTIDDALATTGPALWCAGTSELPSQDLGTPGAENDWCPQIDHDDDGYSREEGDCDDADPEVGRLQLEVWDGKDNDCDSLVDDLFADRSRVGWAYGPEFSQLGGAANLQVADWDGDGIDDLVVPESGYSGAIIWSLDGAQVFAADLVHVDTLTPGQIDGGSARLLGVGPAPGDLDHDGDDDLAVLVSGPFGGDGDLLWLFDAPPAGGDTMTPDDADLIVTQADRMVATGALLSDLDVNGDGGQDVVLADRRDLYGVAQVLDLGGLSGSVDVDDVEIGTWSATERLMLGGYLSGGDLDDDGYDDVLIGEQDTSGSVGAVVHGVLGQSELPEDGPLALSSTLRLSGLNGGLPLRAWILDLDEDGAQDLLVGDPSEDQAYVLFDAGGLSGSVDVPARADLTLQSDRGLCATDAAWADLDRDGSKDLVLGCGSRTTSERGVVMVLPSDALVSGATLDALDASATILAQEPGDAAGPGSGR